MTPISPRGVMEARQKAFPPEVFEAFDELLVKHYANGEATFGQEEVVGLICTKLGIYREEVFAKKYLDVEHFYTDQGWKVYYDTPSYGGGYGATFTFRGGA